jgi:hypothetical protein
MKMAKLEIRDLDHLDELKEYELAEIKGGDIPLPIPRWARSLYRTVFGRGYNFATPIEIP